MKITVLAENTSVSDSIDCEHGLSIFIESNSRRILFDMGQTDLFAKNAEKLSVDLSSADTAVLSHGHYDHGGGIGRFLELNDTASVYVNSHAFEPHYNSSEKYIGLDTGLARSDRLRFTEDYTDLDDGFKLYTCNEKEKFYKTASLGLSVKKDGVLSPDLFIHEQYLLAEENGKRILFSGCSHKGILDIVRWFAPDVLIGGFHFSKLPLDSTLEKYAEILDSYRTVYYTCHCTGVEQYEFMRSIMKNLHYLSAGQVIVI